MHVLFVETDLLRLVCDDPRETGKAESDQNCKILGKIADFVIFTLRLKKKLIIFESHPDQIRGYYQTSMQTPFHHEELIQI